MVIDDENENKENQSEQSSNVDFDDFLFDRLNRENDYLYNQTNNNYIIELTNGQFDRESDLKDLEVEFNNSFKKVDDLKNNYAKKLENVLDLDKFFSLTEEEINEDNSDVFSEIPSYKIKYSNKILNAVNGLNNSNKSEAKYNFVDINNKTLNLIDDISQIPDTLDNKFNQFKEDYRVSFDKFVNAKNKVDNLQNEKLNFISDKISNEINGIEKEVFPNSENNRINNDPEFLKSNILSLARGEIGVDIFIDRIYGDNEKKNDLHNKISNVDINGVLEEAKKYKEEEFKNAITDFDTAKSEAEKAKLPELPKFNEEKGVPEGVFSEEFVDDLNLIGGIVKSYDEIKPKEQKLEEEIVLAPKENESKVIDFNEKINKLNERINNLENVLEENYFLSSISDVKDEIDKNRKNISGKDLTNNFKFLDDNDLKKKYNFEQLNKLSKKESEIPFQDFRGTKLNSTRQDVANVINFKNHYFSEFNEKFTEFKNEVGAHLKDQKDLDDLKALQNSNEKDKKDYSKEINKLTEKVTKARKSLNKNFKRLNDYVFIGSTSTLPTKWKKSFYEYDNNCKTIRNFLNFVQDEKNKIEEKRLADEAKKKKQEVKKEEPKANPEPIDPKAEDKKIFQSFSKIDPQFLNKENISQMYNLNLKYIEDPTAKELYQKRYEALVDTFETREKIDYQFPELNKDFDKCYDEGRKRFSFMPKENESLEDMVHRIGLEINNASNEYGINLRIRNEPFINNNNYKKFAFTAGACIGMTNFLNKVPAPSESASDTDKAYYEVLTGIKSTLVSYLLSNSFDRTMRVDNLVDHLLSTKLDNLDIDKNELKSMYLSSKLDLGNGNVYSYETNANAKKLELAADRNAIIKSTLSNDFRHLSENPEKETLQILTKYPQDIAALKQEKTNFESTINNINESKKPVEAQTKLGNYVKYCNKYKELNWLEKISYYDDEEDITRHPRSDLKRDRKELKNKWGFTDFDIDYAKLGGRAISANDFKKIVKNVEITKKNFDTVRRCANNSFNKEQLKDILKDFNNKSPLSNIRDNLFAYEKALKKSNATKEEFDFVHDALEEYGLSYTDKQNKELNKVKPDKSLTSESKANLDLFNKAKQTILGFDPSAAERINSYKFHTNYEDKSLNKAKVENAAEKTKNELDKSYENLRDKLFNYETVLKGLGFSIDDFDLINKIKKENNIAYTPLQEQSLKNTHSLNNSSRSKVAKQKSLNFVLNELSNYNDLKKLSSIYKENNVSNERGFLKQRIFEYERELKKSGNYNAKQSILDTLKNECKIIYTKDQQLELNGTKEEAGYRSKSLPKMEDELFLIANNYRVKELGKNTKLIAPTPVVKNNQKEELLENKFNEMNNNQVIEEKNSILNKSSINLNVDIKLGGEGEEIVRKNTVILDNQKNNIGIQNDNEIIDDNKADSKDEIIINDK